MAKNLKIRVSIPYTDMRLKRDVRKGEVLSITVERMYELMAVEERENLELFTVISIEKGDF